MTDRARLSKLPNYTSSSPPGSTFLGSASFPHALLNTISKSDPAGMLFPISASSPLDRIPTQTCPDDRARLTPLLKEYLSQKQILVCSGGADKLVPYRCSKPFLDFLKNATDAENGWWKEGGCIVDDRVYEGVGHAYSDGMASDTVAFVSGILERDMEKGTGKGSRL